MYRMIYITHREKVEKFLSLKIVLQTHGGFPLSTRLLTFTKIQLQPQTKSLNPDKMRSILIQTHTQDTLPLQFSSAYPSAGSPTPSFQHQTSLAARLSPLTSPSHCAPSGSAGPWLLSVCPPGASAALPSPGAALRFHCSALECSVMPQSQDLPLTGVPY